jgi:hypothetical protein
MEEDGEEDERVWGGGWFLGLGKQEDKNKERVDKKVIQDEVDGEGIEKNGRGQLMEGEEEGVEED